MTYNTTLKDNVKKLVKSNTLLYNTAMVLLRRRPIANGFNKEVQGTNNSIACSANAIFRNCTFDIRGNNNEITIGDFCVFHNVTFLVRGDNNRISISAGVKFGYGGSLHIEDHHCLISISDNSTFENVHIAVTEPYSQVMIGVDCMFAYDIDLRTGDSHSILDAKTNKRINPPGNITIGDHVWVAPHCSILKGVEIKSNCIVATRTVITRSNDDEGVILGGNPTRVLKENITWSRKRI
jgi:acetyltransferase-like isoleucine patch superfamily enzyme